MNVTLRLDPAARSRLDRLGSVTGKSISAVATDLLRVSCPVAPAETVLVPMDIFMTAVAVEAALAHQMAPHMAMGTYLERGRHVRTADRRSPRVQDLLRHLGGDVFGPAIDRMNDRRLIWAAARSTQHALDRISITIGDDVVDTLKMWTRRTGVRMAALVRVALQPGRMPFALVPVLVPPILAEEIVASAQAHGVSLPMETALWAWNGMFDYFSAARRAKNGDSDLARQIRQVMETQALPHVWRTVVRTTLRHPADAWVFAQWMWYAPLEDANTIARRVRVEPVAKDKFLDGLPESGDQYLYGSLGIDRMMQDVLHPPEPEDEEKTVQA